MNKEFKQIRAILKPQKYSEIFKTNCFGEFIEADEMIKILDYIQRQNDKIDLLEKQIKESQLSNDEEIISPVYEVLKHTKYLLSRAVDVQLRRKFNK